MFGNSKTSLFLLAIGILVVLVLICTRVDSPLCKICAENTPTEKVLVPITEEDRKDKGDIEEIDDIEMTAIGKASYEQ